MTIDPVLKQAVALEFIKHRKNIISVAVLIVVLFLTFDCICAYFIRDFDEGGVPSLAAAVSLMGSVFLALGVSSQFASALRRLETAAVERLLPLSPRKRVAAAYLASLLTFLGLTSLIAVLLASVFLVFPPGNWDLQGAVPPWFSVATVSLSLLLIHANAFVFSYWTRNPGGGITATIAFPGLLLSPTAFLVVRLQPLLPMMPEAARWIPVVSFPLIFCSFPFFCLWAIPPGIERENARSARRLRWKIWSAVAALAIVIPAALLACLVPPLSRSLKQLNRVRTTYTADRLSQLIVRPVVSGVYGYSMKGDLVHLDKDGRRQVLRASPVKHPVSQLIWQCLSGADRRSSDFSDRFMIMRNSRVAGISGASVFFPQDGPRLFRLSFQPAGEVDFVAGAVRLVGSRQWAKLPQNGEQPEWENVDTEQLAGEGTGRHACLVDEGTAVMEPSSGRKWILPAPALLPWAGGWIPPEGSDHPSGSHLYVVPTVQDSGKVRLALCLPSSSSVAMVSTRFESWADREHFQPGVRRHPIPLGGGTVWVTNRVPQILLVVGSDGTVYPPFEVDSKHPYIFDPRRLEGSMLWAVIDRERLVKWDVLTGSTCLESDLGDDPRDHFSVADLPAPEGVYYLNDNRLHLVDWAGKDRDLGLFTSDGR